MDDIFDANDAIFSELVGNNAVVGDRDPLIVGFDESSLVNKLSNSFEIGSSISDIRFNKFEHLQSGTIESDKSCVVNLSESQKLQDLSRFGIDSIDTSNSDDNGKFGFRFNKEVTTRSCFSSEFDERSFLVSVFLHISLSSFENDTPLSSSLLFVINVFLGFLGHHFFSGLSLFQKSFRDWCFLGCLTLCFGGGH